MTHAECLRYLEHVQSLGIKLGLDNIRRLLEALGNPHERRPSVVVAGSNGKGSVCAMLSRILLRQGFRPGLYTSPHLIDYEERIRIGDSPVSRRDFCRLLTRLKGEIEGLLASGRLEAHPTHFEILTCLAWMAFDQQSVDLAILEVGMGGRFDAVNTAVPEISVITTISLEHQKYLGETLAEIAFEKAGVIKPGVPVVCGVEAPEAARILRDRARRLGAPFFEVFPPGGSLSRSGGPDRPEYELTWRGESYRLIPSLPGDHQGRNAAVAAAAAVELGRRWKRIDRESIHNGIASTRWEGRLEIVSRNPVVILDGAHNPQGAEALREYIRDSASAPVILVLAAMRDKAIGDLAGILFPVADEVVLTTIDFHRAAAPEEIAEVSPEFSGRIRLEPELSRALEAAVKAAGTDGTVVAAGSLFLVGAIKRTLRDSGRASASLP